MDAARPVLNKHDMYARLAAGEFGNTIPQFFDVATWLQSPLSQRYSSWGVRGLQPGGRCRLNCPSAEVPTEAAAFAAAGLAYNLSPMIDRVVRVTLWAEVIERPGGLEVYGIERPPPGGSWRALMAPTGRTHRGLTARTLLARHLSPSSLADLHALLERFPDHVIELSACETCFGSLPGRNAVIWECRLY